MFDLFRRASADSLLARLARIERLAPAAAGVLFLERLWLALWPAAAALAAYLGVSLLGVWAVAPVAAQWVALAALAAVAGACAYGAARRLRWPSRDEVLRRIERDSGLIHRPIEAIIDAPSGRASAYGAALWRAHQARAAQAAARLRVTRPQADIPRQDRFATRLAAALLLVGGGLIAGDETAFRLEAAFSPGLARETARTAMVDAWIAPPDYTGAAPIYLARAGQALAGGEAPVAAPEGSVLHIRVSGVRSKPRLRIRGESGRSRARLDAAEGGGFAGEFPLELSGAYRLRAGGAALEWTIDLQADAPPRVELALPPEPDAEGRLNFTVAMADDYGVSETFAMFRLAADQVRPADAPAIDESVLAVTESQLLEGVAGARGAELVEYSADLDLRAHPWAGLEVEFWIEAADGAGQKAVTEPVRALLPERDFVLPLARAVIEQRRNLAVAPDERSRALRSFEAMTVAPDLFFERAGDFLSIRSAYWKLFYADQGPLDELVAMLWPLALSLEEGDLALARRALEEAIENVRAALERGDPPEEVSALLERVQEAMERYIRALAARSLEGDPFADFESGGETMGMDDLSDMLAAIDELSELGSRDAAGELLSRFEQMMRNLQVARGSGGGEDELSEEMREQLSELMGIIGEQRGLMDETFQRDQRREGGEDLAPQQDQLGQASGALGQSLQELGQQGGEGGEGQPSEEGQGGGEAGGEQPGGRQGRGGLGQAGEALEQAGRAMERAEDALRSGDLDRAGEQQGRALEELRQGAQALSDAISERMAGRNRDGQGGGGVDPAGRPTNSASDFGEGVEVPSEFERARVRELLEELRRRAGEAGRPPEELQYLERLLRRF